jgi:hypothetical protein
MFGIALPTIDFNIFCDKPVLLLGGATQATETRFVVGFFTLSPITAAMELSAAVYTALIGYTEGEYRFLPDDFISPIGATLATCIVTGKAMF